jgi:hypothetical protein
MWPTCARTLDTPSLILLQPYAFDDLAILHTVSRNDVELGHRLIEHEAGRVLLLHHPGTDVHASGYCNVEVGTLSNEPAKVPPDSFFSLGKHMACIVLHNGVRAKAANNPLHVPCVYRVDKILSDLYGVQTRILLTTLGRLAYPIVRPAADQSKSERDVIAGDHSPFGGLT